MAILQRPVETHTSDNFLVPSNAGWYPLHGDGASRNILHPTLVQTTSPSAGGWTTQGYYTFPSGNVTDILNSDSNANLDTIFSMVGMVAGNQWIMAWEQVTPNASGNQFQWVYGGDGSSSSYYGIALNVNEVPIFYVRGKGDSGRNQLVGSTSLGVTGQRCSIVCSIEAQSGNTVIVKIKKFLNGTDASPVDLGSTPEMDVLGTGTANPGRSGSSSHPGLTFGGRPSASWTSGNKQTIGNYVALSTARIGNFSVKKFTSYDATRVDAIIADMIARPTEFPRTLL